MPSPETNESALIRRAQQGDTEAAAQLYRRHGPAIFRYFLFRLGDELAAEDLTGEVFLQMVRGLPRFEDRGAPFSAWLYRIAHARLVDHHRRAQVRQTEPLLDTTPDSAPGPEAESFQRAEQRRMAAALATLTEEQQLVVQLRFVEGCSLEQTAQLMQKTVGAVKAVQHRALRSLARAMDE